MCQKTSLLNALNAFDLTERTASDEFYRIYDFLNRNPEIGFYLELYSHKNGKQNASKL